MTTQWSLPVWVVAAALVVVGLVLVALVLALVSLRRRQAHGMRDLRDEVASLQARLDRGEAAPPRDASAIAPAGHTDYVITRLGEEPALPSGGDAGPDAGPRRARPDAGQFLDLLLRESVVQTASLATGVRRALRPEVRDRIRGEVRREVKRARRRRKEDTRAARRAWAAERAGSATDSGAA